MMQRRNKPNPFSSKGQPEPAPAYQEPEEDWEDEYDEPQDDEHKVFGLGIPSADDRQPAYGQGVVISLFSAAAMLLLAIIVVGEGTGEVPPIFQRADTLFWVIGVVALLLTAAGAQYAERVAARTAEENDSGRPAHGLSTAWAIPAVSVFAAVMLIATFHNRWMLLFGPLIAFLGTAGALLSRDLLDEADEESIRVASTVHTAVAHIIAFLALSTIYLNKFESVYAVPLVALISFVLIVETLERAGIGGPTRVLYAALGSWVMAAAMMALNWWPSSGWAGGAVLLAVYYMVAGMLLAHAESRSTDRRTMIEFIGVGSLMLVVLAARDLFL